MGIRQVMGLVLSGRMTVRLTIGCTILALLCSSGALAAPQGENVVSGSATFERAGTTTTITASNRAIINYSSFDVAGNEAVRFVQPSATATVLNRIQSSSPTQINGALQSNGIVYLVNRAGVIFGPGSVVNVGGLYAAASSMSNQDFLAGINRFTDASGAVVNNGTIVANAVGLIGRTVANHGSIVAVDGLVTMVAGKDVLLSEEVGGHIMVRLEGSAEQVTDTPGVENTGSMEAPGGSVLLGAGDMFSLAARQAGSVKADDVTVEGQAGVTEVTGTIDATGTTGGKVAILGEKVSVKGATIDASGTLGGGTILIGGDYQGNNVDVANAQQTFVNASGVLKADAIESGDGGKIIVWADRATWFYGQATVLGGANGGNGGFIETSGKGSLFVGPEAVVGLGAPGGTAGQWLLDPTDVTLTAGTLNMVGDPTWVPDGTTPLTGTVDITAIEAVLELGTGGVVSVSTSPGGGAGPLGGRITVAGAITVDYVADAAASTSTLNLNADADIVVSSPISLSTTDNAGDTFAINLNATTGVAVNAAISNTSGTGTIVLTTTGTTFDNTGGAITTTGGAVDIQNTGAVTIVAGINAGAGNVTIAGTDSAFGGTLAASIGGAGTITSSGTVTLESAASVGTVGTPQALAATGTITAQAATDVYLSNTGDVSLGATTATAGTLSVTNTGTLTIAGALAGGTTVTLQGAGAGDTLIGSNVANVWLITGADSGTLNGITFSSFENLTGGTNTDAFTLSTGTVSGLVTGGAGSDTLTGANLANTWTTTGADTGTLTGTGGFAGMEVLVGNANVDAFTFAAGAFTGTVDGVGGADTFTLNGGTITTLVTGGLGSDTLTGDNVANTWTTTGADAGTLTGTGGFTGMEVLVGNAAVDAFSFNAGAFAGAVDGAGGDDTFTLNGGTIVGMVTGGAGSDTLTGHNVANTWTTTGADAGTLTGTGGFTGMEVLVGNAAVDAFSFNAGAFAGAVDGAGGDDTFTLAGGTIVGMVTGGADSDTLTGHNVANTWTLTGAGSGTLTGTGGFVGMESLGGGTNNDVLTIDLTPGAAILAGMTFNGGAGGSNAIIMNPGAGGPFTTVTHTFTNANDGSIDVDGSALQYTQLSPITDNLIPANRVFTFAAGAVDDAIFVANAGAADDNISRISSLTSETVAFVNPTTSLTINTGAGTDSLSFAPDTSAGLVAYAGTTDVNATGVLTVNGVVTGGDFTATVGDDFFTTGLIATGGGNIDLSSTGGSIRIGADLDSRDPAPGNAGDITIQTVRTAMTDVSGGTGDWRPNNLIIFGTGVGSVTVRADSGAVYGDITINTNGVRPQTPSVATIVGDVGAGNLVFAGENFTMGPLEKVASTGSVYITRDPLLATFMTLTRLSDITAANFIGIRANTIDFLVRDAAVVVDADGTLVGDTGVNLIANNLNVMAGGGGVTHTGPGPDATGGSPFGVGIFPGTIIAVGAFTTVVLDDPMHAPPISLSGGANRWGLDAVGEVGFIPTNLASTLASALPGQQVEVSLDRGVDASQREDLVRHLGIYTRGPTVTELLDYLSGRKFFNDAPHSKYAVSSGDFFGAALSAADNKVSIDRLPGELAHDALVKYRQVYWREVVDTKANKKIWKSVAGDIRKTLEKSIVQYKEKTEGKFDPVAYRTWVASTPTQKDANNLLAQLESLFHKIKLLGLGPVEQSISLQMLARSVKPRGLSVQETIDTVLKVAGAPAQQAQSENLTAAR